MTQPAGARMSVSAQESCSTLILYLEMVYSTVLFCTVSCTVLYLELLAIEAMLNTILAAAVADFTVTYTAIFTACYSFNIRYKQV